MTRNNISNGYFEWLSKLVCGKRYSKQVSYRKLLMYLHNTEFRYSIPMDANRAEDGMDLRYKYMGDDCDLYLRGPCSVLEMMIALSVKCEEEYMDDPHIGDRTGEWFWHMIVSLGLGSMFDERFDEYFVESTIERFLDRDYEPDGHGGLFTIRDCEDDLRDVEIWYQFCWYLDSIS